MNGRAITAIFLSQFLVQPAFPQAISPGSAFRDCDDCPEMIVLSAGKFTMGRREAGGAADAESPAHLLTIEYQIAVGRLEVTRGQYAAFVKSSGHVSSSKVNCSYLNLKIAEWSEDDATLNWDKPGIPQGDDHPVVCVSWADAKVYVAWLSEKTKRKYRLLTEAEWEYAARAGSRGPLPWGEDSNETCKHANVSDNTRTRELLLGVPRKIFVSHFCDDGVAYTAPGGRYSPNRFGLYDMLGNVWEWVEDCWNSSYSGAPTDGSAWLSGDCSQRVLRGASWHNSPFVTRSSYRDHLKVEGRATNRGFRVALGM